ncbi:MAG: hypothetical protein KDA63_15400 [Planctomycetales bacterium]|nr:hypothetical protein [Planctomycetales bacterium]
MAEGKSDDRTFYLQLATLACVVVGGIIGYFLIDRRVAEVDIQLKQAEKENKDLDVAKKKTPILGMTATTELHRDSSWDSSETVGRITLNLLFENLGFSAIHLGDLKVEVSEAFAAPELEGVLERSTQGLAAPAPASAEVQQDDTSSLSLASVGEENNVDERDGGNVNKRGKLYPIGSHDLTWSNIEDLTKNVPVNFELEQSQRRTMAFDFVLDESSRPKWYRFAVSIAPPRDDTSWKPLTVDAVVPGGGPSSFMETMGNRKVFETKTVEATNRAQPVAPPIPLGDD